MKIWLGRELVIVLILVLGGGSAIAYALFKAQDRMDRRIEIAAYSAAIPSDFAALERGE